MANKDIEIPFGAYDSELDGFEYTIPEGYKAEIKDGKVVVKKTESEDEKIRKAIYNCVKWFGFDSCFFKDVSQEECLAWLEKQGEQEPDKIEPKFKVSDWLVNKNINEAFCITQIHAPHYYLTNKNSFIKFGEEDNYRPWTIQDAKDGDVLAAHECLVLFREIDGLNIRCYCTYHFMNNPSFYVDTLQNKNAFHPATKEQRDQLENAMADAGWEFDFEKKKLKKIEQKLAETEKGIKGNEREIPNSAWGEEDELYIRELESLVKQVWATAEHKNDKDTIHKMSDLSFFLKTLKPQNTWKPSVELPIWEKVSPDTGQTRLYIDGDRTYLERFGYRIDLKELDKLPKKNLKAQKGE